MSDGGEPAVLRICGHLVLSGDFSLAVPGARRPDTDIFPKSMTGSYHMFVQSSGAGSFLADTFDGFSAASPRLRAVRSRGPVGTTSS